MTPEELAVRHPRLYHVTTPGAWESIREKGLLSTTHILNLFEIEGLQRRSLEAMRRSSEVPLKHPHYGHLILNDNVPLSDQALRGCLDDQLTPSDWLRLLNARVFFWPSEESLNRLLSARLNRQRQREVIVVDTLSLARKHAQHIELCPINSGATLRKAARRGLNTFTPMLKHSFKEWSKLRGRRDEIREVTVHSHVIDIADHMVEVFHTPLK